MCGIAGIIGRVSDGNRAALARMSGAMAHRGPSSEGFWFSDPAADDAGCLFAHRRLSILDLSTSANQPMTEHGRTLIFNGEIYNYVAQRQTLQSAGERFDSTGDTAVMLRMLRLHGAEALPQLRGMFAFGLWNHETRELMLARDPLGIKPLYIARNPDENGEWSLLFASEVRAILASQYLGTPKLNPEAVASVVWNGFVMGPNTAVIGIESLQPGEMRMYDARGRQQQSKIFWTLRDDDNSRPTSEEELRAAIHESVRLHLASDVPLGVFLSSGIDSSAIANLAQKASDTPINTFTLTFEDENLNEGNASRPIAQAIGSNHREILLRESDFVSNLERALDTLDQPTFDGLNSFYMSKAVREAGLTVALVGTGGDELFGGYTSFRDLPPLHRWANRSGWIPQSAKVGAAKMIAYALAGSGGAVAPQTRWAKLPDFVRSGSDLIGLYQLAYALFRPGFQRELMRDGLVNGTFIDGMPRSMHQRLESEVQSRSPLGAIGVMEQRCFLGERLLRDTDAASMAVSLEVRLPLVDQILVRNVNRLPDDPRFAPLGKKSMLRRIGLEGMDPALFDRPKRGFVLPFERWIKQSLGSSMNEMMRDEKAAASVGLNGKAVARLWEGFRSNQPGLYWSRVWALFVLMRWSQRHGIFL